MLVAGLSFHTKAYAYSYFWGLKVPTSLSEVKATFSEFNNKYFIVEEVIEDSSDLIEMEVTEVELNRLLSKYAINQKYEQFTLDDIKVELLDNKIIADLVVNQINANVTLVPIKEGTRLEIIELDIGESGYLSSIKESFIKTAFNSIQPKLVSEYFKDFHSMRAEKGKITIFLKREIESL